MEKQIFIDGLETNYTISEEGIVKNSKTGRIMKINKGNVQITVSGKNTGRSVGKIVAEAFIPNPDNLPVVDHIDGDKMNNKVENLRWISNKQNSLNTWEKRRENGTTNAGRKLGKRKRENIVEINPLFLTDDEKQIKLDGELIPYSVNKNGEIRNLRTGKFLKGSILHTYRYINFRWDGKQKNKAVHRLVAETFLPNENDCPMVDHIDGDRLNNKIENLRWVTPRQNFANIHLDKTPNKPQFQEVVFTEKELLEEEWREYCGYKISNLGRVKNLKDNILLGTSMDCGYINYSIKGRRILGHVLIWEVFNGPKKDGMVINHINGNKHDNRLLNLEEITHQENLRKASEETNAWGFREVGEFDEKGNMLRKFANASVAAREIGILPGSMRNTIRRNGKCHNGLYYKYLEKQ